MDVQDGATTTGRTGPLQRLKQLIRRLFLRGSGKKSEKPNIYPLY
jgi:hypothetical protein